MRLWPAIVAEASSSIQGVPEAFSAALATTKTSLNTGFMSMVQLIRSKSTAFQSAGIAIMQGLNNGINSMRSTLLATARSIANSISSTLNNAMQIHSPSRVTFQTGEYVGMGLAGGMQSKVPEIKGAALDMSYAAIPYGGNYTPENSSTYYSGGNSEVNTIAPVFNLTVSGSTDDRATARKVKRYVAEAIRETFESMGRKVVTQ